MEKKQRAQDLVMAPLEALTGAMKSVLVPAPQPLLPKAVTETEVGSGTGTEIEIGIETGIETETGTEIGNGTETGIETETEIGTEIETESETERVLFAVSVLSQWRRGLG